MKFRLRARQILPEGIILPRPWRSKKRGPPPGGPRFLKTWDQIAVTFTARSLLLFLGSGSTS